MLPCLIFTFELSVYLSWYFDLLQALSNGNYTWTIPKVIFIINIFYRYENKLFARLEIPFTHPSFDKIAADM